MRVLFWLSAGLLLLLAGCAPKTVENQAPVFFPPEPNPPRVQFLMGISSSGDVEGNETEFSLFSLDDASSDESKALTKPYGIAAGGGKIFVADTMAGKVAVIDLAGKKFEWLKGDFGPGKLGKPVNLTADKAGNLYVVDRARGKIFVYDPEGNFKRIYGETYDMKPVDVEMDDERLYVLDISRSEIQVFDKESGRRIGSIGGESENPEERLSLPTNMALSERGIFYVSNITTGQIVKLDRDGHVLGIFGKMGDGFGQFGRPKGVAADAQDRFFVVDSAHQNVQLFDENGRLLMFFGDPGLPAGSMDIPAGIAVTADDLEIYQKMAAPDFELEQVVMVTNQVGRNKVGIYGFGRKKDFDYEKYDEETKEIWRQRDESRAEEEKEK